MEALKVAIADDNENMLKVLGQVIGQEAITALNITWPQMSDLQGWNNAGAKLYGVNSIPAYNARRSPYF